jgi:hypothetical protein
MIEYALSSPPPAMAWALLLDLWRIAAGPDEADRILALDTMVINVIALWCCMAMWRGTGDLFRGRDADRHGRLRLNRRLLPLSAARRHHRMRADMIMSLSRNS